MTEDTDYSSHGEYENHSLAGEYSKMSVEVNNKEYLLTSDVLDHIENIAESYYDGNEYVEYYWRLGEPADEDHEAGDPLLCIETRGSMVPWEDLSEMEMEMQDVSPVGAQSDDDSDDRVDNGNGTVGRDPDGNGEGEIPDFKQPIFPKEFRPYPDPDDEDVETLPPKPEEYPGEEPELIVPVPASERDEVWETGESMIESTTYVEWNIQKRVDSAEDGSTEIRPGNNSAVQEVEKDNNHNDWEAIFRGMGAPVVGEMKPSNRPEAGESGSEESRKPWNYDEADKNESKNDGEVGNRWI